MRIRTSFFDRETVGALQRGATYMVNLGAGYDGRSLRFSGSGAEWIEVDHPLTQSDKRARVAALGCSTSHVTWLPLDLISQDLDAALENSGHSTSGPSCFLAEGLLSYLPPNTCREVLQSLRSRAHTQSVLVASVVVTDQSGARIMAQRKLVDGLLSGIGEARLSEFRSGSFEEMLAACGWKVQRKQLSEPHAADGALRLLVTAATPR